MSNLRLVPVWGWVLIVAVAVLMTFLTFAVVPTPTTWETSTLICDANGENCEPLE
jgi:hypothetical protein